MNRKAFTLVELLVVAAVIALLASVLFSLFGAREGARISNALSFQSQTHSLLGSDLIGRWDFNDPDIRYKDSSGSNNHGGCSSCPTLVDGVPGVMGSAMNFDGVGNGIEIPSSPRFDFRGRELTITSWVNPDVSSFGRIVSQYATISIDSGGAFVHTDGISPSVLWSNCGGISNDSWYYLVMTFERSSSKLTIYKNGDECHSSIGSGEIERFNGGLWVGSGAADWNQRYRGIIDDVRVYSRALTASEVQTIYTQVKGAYFAKE